MVTVYHVSELECYSQIIPIVKTVDEEEVPLCLCKKGKHHLYDLWAVSRWDETNRVLLAGGISAEDTVKEINKARTVWLPEDYYMTRTLHKSTPEVI